MCGLSEVLQKAVDRYSRLLQELTEGEAMSFANEGFHGWLPTTAGVYAIWHKDHPLTEPLYVGKAGDLRTRVYTNHLHGSSAASSFRSSVAKKRGWTEAQVTQYLKNECVVRRILLDDPKEGSRFEHFAIAVFAPEHNQ